MKRNSKFRNVSLLQKNPINLRLFLCIAITFGILSGEVILIDLSCRFLGIKTIVFICFVVMAYSIYRIWKWYYIKEKDTSAKMVKKLRFFLKANNLYVNESKKQQIVNSAVLGYLVTDKEIIIRAYKGGDSFTNKMGTLDNSLCALLDLPLENKLEKLAYCDYVFSRYKDERIIIRSAKSSYNNTTFLHLSRNLQWNILKQPHLLLAGVTGSGKTTFLNYLIIEMKKMKADIYICDPKRSDLASLKYILGTDHAASDSIHIAKLSRIVKEKMEQRFIDYKENVNNFVYGHSFVDYKLKPVFLIFDELGAFRASADKKVFAETMANLTEIILKGREMGVFCVLSTQQPNANNIPTELRDNLSVRLAMGSMSSEAYRMVFGEDIKDLQAVNAMGSGYIFLDGLGWSKPKFFEAPYLDYKKFNFIEELKKYYKEDTLAENL